MQLVRHVQNLTTSLALLMLVAAPMLSATPAEARRVAAGCGTRGCAAVCRRRQSAPLLARRWRDRRGCRHWLYRGGGRSISRRNSAQIGAVLVLYR
jgi:hypothetical protein